MECYILNTRLLHTYSTTRLMRARVSAQSVIFDPERLEPRATPAPAGGSEVKYSNVKVENSNVKVEYSLVERNSRRIARNTPVADGRLRGKEMTVVVSIVVYLVKYIQYSTVVYRSIAPRLPPRTPPSVSLATARY